MKKILIFLAVCPLFWACNKTRYCECKNSNGIYTAGEVDGSRSRAKKFCKNLSTATTECYLKK